MASRQAEKENARRQIGASLDAVAERLEQDPKYRTPARYVRVNAVGSERFIEDTKAVVRHGLEGLVVPKVDNVAQVRIVEDELGRAEVAHHMPGGSVKLLIAIESPIGLFNAYAIASSSARIIGLIFGAEDFTREMNLPMRREAEAVDMIYARSHIATAAAAAHVQAVDGVWVDLNDMEGMKRFARQARRLGMSGISIIHPNQIDEANAAFTPTARRYRLCASRGERVRGCAGARARRHRVPRAIAGLSHRRPRAPDAGARESIGCGVNGESQWS